MNFPTDKESIEKRIQSIDVIKYSKNRNFINGSVTHHPSAIIIKKIGNDIDTAASASEPSFPAK